MDAMRQEQQCLGDGVPQGAYFAQCGAVSGGMSNILRSPSDLRGGTKGAVNSAEIWTEGKAKPGDGV